MDIFHRHHEVRRAREAYKVRLLNNMNGIGNGALVISLIIALLITWKDIGLVKEAKVIMVVGVVIYLVPLILQTVLTIRAFFRKRNEHMGKYR